MQKINYDKFNEVVYYKELRCGMKVYVIPEKEPYYTTFAQVFIPFGSLITKFEVNGVIHEIPAGSAHFLEHKIFAMPNGDAFSKLSKLGANANAMTSYSSTIYNFSCVDNFKESLLYLLKMLDTPYFTDKNVNDERKIIAEELNMYNDDISYHVQDVLFQKMYSNHPIRDDIGGTIKTIKKIDKNVLNLIYDNFYSSNQRILVVGGKVNLDEIDSIIAEYDFDSIANTNRKVINIEEPITKLKNKVTLKTETIIPKIAIGVKIPFNNKIGNTKKEVIYSLLLNMLFGRTTKNHEKIMNTELSNSSFWYREFVEEGMNAMMITSDTNKPDLFRKEIIKILTKTKENSLKEKDFDRLKKSCLGEIIFAMNNVEGKVYLYGLYKLVNEDYFKTLDVINEITLDDLKEVLKEIKKENIVTVVTKSK